MNKLVIGAILGLCVALGIVITFPVHIEGNFAATMILSFVWGAVNGFFWSFMGMLVAEKLLP